ncbi:MAG: 30S ribosomal protein S1 [Syntrophobacteraceae bacterium]
MVDKDSLTPEETAEDLAADVSMTDDTEFDGDIEDMASLQDLYDQSFQNIQEGEVIRGRIVQISDDFIMVDIGYKSEGQIPVYEFRDEKGELQAAIGDEVDVLLEYQDDEDGSIHLSKEKAAKIKVWDDISRIYNDDGLIEGKVVAKVKGGLAVDIGVQAFLPGSQVDLRPVRNLEHLIGHTYPFKVLKYNKKRRNVVLSRRALLEKERENMKSQTLSNLEENKIVEGTVKNITDYGVFVDLGGIDGLLHITDMSWGRVGHPSEIFQIGDKINVMVLSFDRDHERVSLGLKQLAADPWADAEGKYPVGTKVTGRVVSLTDYGAFVEIEQGVEGLIHVSEMSWTKKIRHPSKILNVGDEVGAVVLSINPDNKRISLGMKQLDPNPWDVIAEKYPVGTTIAGRIKNITDFGVFIGIDEGIDGLVHISDISWTKRIKHPSEVFKKNQEVQAIVLNIDKQNERFSLGIKQLEQDPWETIPERYPIGSLIQGPITNVTDFGLFVEIEEGIEGLVHVSEISKEKIKSPVGQYKTGDTITAKVINISPKDRKIGLSVKKIEEQEERTSYDEFSNSGKAATSNLGELLKEEMEARSNSSPPQDKDR